jgi:hypothetical protein
MSNTTYSEGRYQAEILEHGFEESSVKGTPGFFIQLKILARYDEEGRLRECPQYERTYRQYLANETGVNILRGDMKAIDVQLEDLAQLDPGAPKGLNLRGRKIDVACRLETYQGQQRERWGIARNRKKLNLNEVRILNDRFGHLLRDGKSQAGPAPAVTEPNQRDSAF